MKILTYKSLILICLIIHSINGYSDISKSNETYQSIIKKTDSVDCNDELISDYTIRVNHEGLYHLYFWTLSPRDKENNLVCYNVDINDHTLGLSLDPQSDGWHFSSLKNNPSIELKQGENHIRIYGSSHIYPEVGEIFATPEIKNLIYPTEMDEFINSIVTKDFLSEVKNRLEIKSLNSISDNLSQYNPPYDYYINKNVNGAYSFFSSLNLSMGKEIEVKLTKVSDSSKQYIIQVFNSVNPASFSICSTPSNFPSIRFNAPSMGRYVVRVRPLELNEVATASVLISEYTSGVLMTKNTFNDVPVSSLGIPAIIPNDEEYNTFTTQSDGDPMLWIEGIPTTGEFSGRNIVLSFNDNGPSLSFNWDKDAKIETKLVIPSTQIFLTSKSSLSPIVTSDIYYKIKSYREENTLYYINSSDLMESAPMSDKYNCLAWVCGIYEDNIWPYSDVARSPSAKDSLEDTLLLNAFDKILGTPQYSGAATYTRSGATEDNAVINLWKNDNVFSHFSIKRGSDNNHHGYDWESKLGSYKRIFHPENNTLLSYGSIAYRYRLLTLATNSCLQEAVANGENVVEYIDFTENEYKIINSLIKIIPEYTILKFNELFKYWEEFWEKSVLSNPFQIAICDEYNNLRKFLNSNPDCLNLLYIKIAENSPCTYPLFIECILKYDNESLKEYENSLPLRNPAGISIYRPIYAKMTGYIKKRILNSDSINNFRENQSISAGISYSNQDDVNITSDNSCVNIMINLSSSSSVEVKIFNSEGKIVRNIAPKQYESGMNHISTDCFTAGVYIVAVYIEGRHNAKKICIR